MNTLRAKLIVLLAGSILIVVALATWLTSLTLWRPDFSEVIRANAAQIGLLLEQVQDKGVTTGNRAASIQEVPAGGEALQSFTADLRAELTCSGLPADATVTRPPGSPWAVVSLKLPGEGRYLIAPAAVPPQPPSIYPVLIGWMALIATGATAISVAAVYRLTQPSFWLNAPSRMSTPKANCRCSRKAARQRSA
jgi:hypothetical protein